ncbi:MAG TPA: oxidoreductase [Chloroflexi bacterium]|nr:oxidoreductase [Chloroflexota bacterium]HCG30995.1 oxidoreductase [Chloroflexota bacterium]
MAGYEEGDDVPRIPGETLRDWVVDILETCGIGREDGEIVADILVESDLRGIDSHGVPRLRRLYVDRLLNGTIRADAKLSVVRETAATVTFDAGHGLGPLMAYKAMERTIEKARDAGVCLATVGHSDHFGIAGYYATMALRFPGMAGIAMTNATPLMVPTFGKEAMLSTAPIAAAFPAGVQDPFVLDAATTTVAWGKVEIARRMNAPLPEGLAVDEHGRPTTDPFVARALMPLGGERETSGQKGYGLGLLVEMLCSQLSGSLWSKEIAYSNAEGPQYADTSHAFMALDIQAFRPLDEYAASVDEMFATLRNAEPVEPGQRVMIPGDPEAIALADRLERGIPLHPSVTDELRELGDERGVPYPG